MRLTGLRLKGVGCFDDADFEFPEGKDDTKADAYVFVGPNGSGKTTALLAMAQFFASHPTGLSRRFRPSGSEARVFAGRDFAVLTQRGRDPGLPPVEASFVGELGGSTLWLPRRSGELSRRVHDHQLRSIGAFAHSGARTLGEYSVQMLSEQTQPAEKRAVSFGQTTASWQEFVQWVANTISKRAIAESQRDEEKAAEKRVALERVNSIVSRITSSDFELKLSIDPADVAATMNGTTVRLDVLPDGVKSILSWVGDILMRIDRTKWPDDRVAPLDREHLIFLDEIDIHLHPKWQRSVLPAVQSLFPKSQIFLTTHSPFVIASATDAFIYKLEDGKVSRPIPSNEGMSISAILESVMGVSALAQFSPQVEARLTQFNEELEKGRSGDDAAATHARAIAAELARGSPELAVLLQHKLRVLPGVARP